MPVVLAARRSREDPLLTRMFSAAFYKLFRLLVSADMPAGGFDFFLLDRRVADLLVQHAEKNAMLPAAILWLGFRREFVLYDRAERAHGTSMWTFWKKLKYMYDALLTYSYVPLRVMTVVGLLGLVFGVGYGILVVLMQILHPGFPAGWASLMVVTLTMSGMVLASLGTVGEYVWRTFEAARARPNFIVDVVREPATSITLEDSK